MEDMERLEGKSVLVTGGTGLVGGHLVEALLQRKCRVVIPYRSVDPRSYFSTQKLAERSIMAIGDLKDAERMFDIVTKYEIEYIFHLGAQPIVPTAYNNPLETIATNVMGTVHVLESARRYPGVKGVIVASSDKAYGKSDKPYQENDPLRGDHPYEVSKSSADLIAYSYFKTYGLSIVITRFGNIYGPGDLNISRIVPGIMKTILTEETLELRSDGTYVRDYIYVNDVVTAYIFLMDNINKASGNIYNISSNYSYSVFEMIKQVERILHKKVPYRVAHNAINEIPYQHLDCAKITALGWRPQGDLDDSIHKTYDWYKAYKIFPF